MNFLDFVKYKIEILQHVYDDMFADDPDIQNSVREEVNYLKRLLNEYYEYLDTGKFPF